MTHKINKKSKTKRRKNNSKKVSPDGVTVELGEIFAPNANEVGMLVHNGTEYLHKEPSYIINDTAISFEPEWKRIMNANVGVSDVAKLAVENVTLPSSWLDQSIKKESEYVITDWSKIALDTGVTLKPYSGTNLLQTMIDEQNAQYDIHSKEITITPPSFAVDSQLSNIHEPLSELEKNMKVVNDRCDELEDENEQKDEKIENLETKYSSLEIKYTKLEQRDKRWNKQVTDVVQEFHERMDKNMPIVDHVYNVLKLLEKELDKDEPDE